MPLARHRPTLRRTFIVRHRGAKTALRILAISPRDAARCYCESVPLDVEDEVVVELLRDDDMSWLVDVFYPQELERGRVSIPRLN